MGQSVCSWLRLRQLLQANHRLCILQLKRPVTLGQLLLTALITSSTFGLFIQVSHNNGFLPVRAPRPLQPDARTLYAPIWS